MRGILGLWDALGLQNNKQGSSRDVMGVQDHTWLRHFMGKMWAMRQLAASREPRMIRASLA